MKNLLKLLFSFMVYFLICTNVIANCCTLYTDEDRPIIDHQPRGALAYDPDSACTKCCGGLSTCCPKSLRGFGCALSIRGCFEPACSSVPDCCNRRHGVWCSMCGCDEVPDEYDYAVELEWHYFYSPLCSWKRSWQCCAGLGVAADIFEVMSFITAKGGVFGTVPASISLPITLGLPIAVMSLSCLTPRLCPKMDYLCYSNSCIQCSGYAAACLPWIALVGGAGIYSAIIT